MSSTDNHSEAPARDPLAPSLLPVRIEIEYADRVSFALEQAGISLVGRVAITNVGDQTVDGIVVKIEVDNGECDAAVHRIERLAAESTFSLKPITLRLSPSKLAARTEAERSSVRVTVSSSAGVATKDVPVDLLAFDQWPGTGLYPELLAAFVTPNHALVAEFLTDARQALRSMAQRDALDGYQSANRQRATQIAESCFLSAHTRGFGYINPPASFDRDGQRVRLIDRVCREKMGCCLDLSVLMASLWEQAGLHPLVILLEGHALPAVWTHDAQLAEPAIDDPAQVRNLIKLGEIVPVESTLLAEPGATFRVAVEAAMKRLESPGNNFCAIDIRCARKRGVRPLPLRQDADRTVVDISPETELRPSGAALDAVALADRVESEPISPSDERSNETPSARAKRWQARLLDLSLQNRLINFRETGRTLRLAVPDLPDFENGLADERRYAIHFQTDGDDAYRQKQLEQGIVYSEAPPAKTQTTLLTLYRTRKSAIDETGANPLYLALGMLKWYESDESEATHRAPIILLPVQLVRHVAASGYRYDLSLSDEPIRPNVTLLEKLRTEFGLDTRVLADLPEDDSGIDVPRVLRNFREAIKALKRWEVEESAYLGLFSFNKFLMWRDLQEHLETLKQSRLVSHLLERPDQEFPSEPLPRPDRLDAEVRPGELFCTRDADSSQLAAIRAASNNQTFVLEGPPGTGKSQTIANIIADSIARGKRVLFVAEKMAALGVVSDRLKKDGLGDFCLELHSAKASKKEVLAQLGRALDSADAASPAEWDGVCNDLAAEQSALNEYVQQLHRGHASGETLYQVMGRLSRLPDGPRIAPLITDVAGTTAGQLDHWRRRLGELVRASDPVDPVHTNDLRGVGRSTWGFTLVDQAREALASATSATGGLQTAIAAILTALRANVDESTLNRDSLAAFVRLTDLIASNPVPPTEMLTAPDASTWSTTLRDLVVVGKARDTARNKLLQVYRRELLDIDVLPLLDEVGRALKKSGPLGLWARYSARRRVRRFCLGEPPALAQLQGDLESARQVREHTARLVASTDAARLLGARWRSGEANWDELSAMLAWCESFREPAAALAATPVGTELVDSIARAVTESTLQQHLASCSTGVRSASVAWKEAWKTLESLLVTSRSETLGPGRASGWLPNVVELLSRWTNGLGALHEWCAWREARDHAVKAGLAPLVESYERGELPRTNLADSFERGFGYQWFNAVADSIPAVRDFNVQSQTDRIARFGALDQRLLRLTPAAVRARRLSNRPHVASSASPQSESGILSRELQKRARHLPTRRLIEAIPNLLCRLKPCFLMSPLSVAQYLDAKLPPFDIVIFDEASQIPVWDSIGAIARGKEVVVVGDSKQLPPTNFFATVDGEDAVEMDSAAVDDMESILQECTASRIPSMLLNWHYRSQHESLIAFSNHHYYHNKLHTFPSPIDRSPDLGVTFRHVVAGQYDRGGSRTNRVEAELVVEEIVRLLSVGDSTGSIGIVTFNQAQQALIEDLLDAERREHPEIERFFTSEVDEPVFVKNLENVQGDERDEIIFSIGYGPDQTGKISMNFGPLNADGGERRLNVAVTRARKRLCVFSSIRSDQIDLRRTRAVGVAHFKTFLDYAFRGPQAIAEAVALSGAREFESGFEQAVWQELTSRGWSVDTQVGCAGYRVDLAVRDPKRAGRYLLGVECDGASYHSAKTARDRDRLRESVLRSLGWQIARVWSTDWRINRSRCIRALEETLKKLVEQPLAPPLALSPPIVKSTVPTAADAPTLFMSASVNSPAPPRRAAALPEYRAAAPPSSPLNVVDIHEPHAIEYAMAQLVRLVRAEGPIVRELAVRRMADWCDVQRVTDRFRRRILNLLAGAISRGLATEQDDVLWPIGIAPNEYMQFRVPGQAPDSLRDVEMVPSAELVNAVAYVVRQQVGIPRDDLEREVGRLLGLQRVTSGNREVISDAVKRALAQGRVCDRMGMITDVVM